MDHGTRIRWLLGHLHDTSIGTRSFVGYPVAWLILIRPFISQCDLFCDMAQSAMLVVPRANRAIRLSMVFGYRNAGLRQVVLGILGIFD